METPNNNNKNTAKPSPSLKNRNSMQISKTPIEYGALRNIMAILHRSMVGKEHSRFRLFLHDSNTLYYYTNATCSNTRPYRLWFSRPQAIYKLLAAKWVSVLKQLNEDAFSDVSNLSKGSREGNNNSSSSDVGTLERPFSALELFSFVMESTWIA